MNTHIPGEQTSTHVAVSTVPHTSPGRSWWLFLGGCGVALGAFLLGVYTAGVITPSSLQVTNVTGTQASTSESVSFESFWDAWKILDSTHIDTDTVTPQERVWGAMRGLARSFDDPYTDFLPPDELETFQEDVMGNFGGVGMEIDLRDGFIVVIAPLKDTPAEEAGVRPGDIIVAIDGEPLVNPSIDRAVARIRGEVETEVTLSIVRTGQLEPLDLVITRGLVTIPTIETELRDDGVFVIGLFNFSAFAEGEFRSALRAFIKSESDKLIIDVRNNPGGFLDVAIDLVSHFVSAGTPIVREVYGEGDEVVHRSVGYRTLDTSKIDLVVLMNEGSASASEILAGALSEHGIATLVGGNTFGKGSVQELVPLDDAALKVTVAKWLTPHGLSISDGGLTPDIAIDYTLEDFHRERDPQLDAAVAFLLDGSLPE